MDIDYRLAFDMAPVGLALSRNRTIIDCNQHLCEIVDSQLREIVVGDGAVAARPAGELGIRLAEHADALGDPGKLVVHVESP